jgi:hypothetical protein
MSKLKMTTALIFFIYFDGDLSIPLGINLQWDYAGPACRLPTGFPSCRLLTGLSLSLLK